MTPLDDPASWLPFVFACLMGLAGMGALLNAVSDSK